MYKIPFYKARRFGDTFSDTFDFFKQSWRTIVRLGLYILLPLTLLQVIGVTEYYRDTMSTAMSGTAATDPLAMYRDLGPGFILMLVASWVMWIFAVSMIYGLMKYYHQGDGDLSQLTLKTFWKAVQGRCFKRSLYIVLFSMIFVASIISVIICIAYFGGSTLNFLFTSYPLNVIVVVGIIGLIFLIFVFSLPLTLWAPIYLMEDQTSIFDALRKTYRYGMRTWGSLFLLTLIMGLLINLITTIVMVPGLIMLMIQVLVFPQLTGVGPVIYAFITYIVMVVVTFIGWVATMPFLIAFGFHYGSAAEKIDHVTAAADIAHFNELGDNNADDPDVAPRPSEIDDFEKL